MVPLTPEERSHLLLAISNAEKKLTPAGGRLDVDLKIPRNLVVVSDREGMMRLGLAALRFALEADPPPPRKDGTPIPACRDFQGTLSEENGFTSLGLIVYPDDGFQAVFFRSPVEQLVFSLRKAFGRRTPPK